MKVRKIRNLGTAILVIAIIIISGITALNCRWNESWALFWYDLKSGFSSVGYLYVVCLWIILVFAFVMGIIAGCIMPKMRNSQTKQKGLIALCMIVLVPCIVINYGNIKKSVVKCYWEPTKTIGHSFGAINGDTYTCSLEAFEYNYRLGRRTFEVDMLMTTDNKLVLKHDWNKPKQEGISEKNQPTCKQFLAAKIDDKYTPLSYEMLCELMVEYPDIWIVTDTKYTEPDEIKRQFRVLIDDAQAFGCPEILDRLIVQVYSEQMHEIVSSMYDFKSYIFTMYKLFHDEDKEGNLKSVCRYCVNNGIEIVTIDYTKYNDNMKKITKQYGRTVYLHTIDDIDFAKAFLNENGGGVYTNNILEEDLQLQAD
ncbi:MAG: hypothetical protein HDR19_03340 [Lachnospiraceae bacterium]|nr:hypothetical protein [Lachnospiraceae bacterium]